MFQVQSFALFMVVVAFGFSEVKSECAKVPLYYTELGCTPVNGPDGCPIKFDCPTVYKSEKCVLNGKTYEYDQEVPDTETPPCSIHCRCRGNKENPTFECITIECPELFAPRDPNCLWLKEKNECCASKKICEKAEIDRIPTCHLDGKEYKEGTTMYPTTHPCVTCDCVKEFDNSTIVSNPNCRNYVCNIELYGQKSIREGCAPIYYNQETCCPIEWKCPSSSDSVVSSGKKSESVNPDVQCKFGALTMELGDKVPHDADKCVECVCSTPPVVTCIKKKGC